MSRRHRTYGGPEVDVTFDPARCIHSERCIRGLPRVFDRERRPWVDASAAAGDAIVEAVRSCPTGALGVVRRDGVSERPDPVATIEPVADGPLYVRGDVRLAGPEGPGGDEPVRMTRLALCRCGRSENKPFCDNAHVEAGFEDAGEVSAPATAAESDLSPGEIRIVPRADGPLLVGGTIRIRSDDGTAGVYQSPALCRCGHSSNRPFCDGSHKTAGFRAAGQA